ncbi:molybdopterin synthase catalytic subunit [Aspergillus tubingensis]|uniref:molybdopterin synthase catalytic subunit n=1 Tax=Aspergillus tubingensis TaxID=5068 RepID=UPI0015793BCB|nr:molybdopterin synthase large subunit CnxH [Aspergillus tubingensis]GFN15024.1 molybdopterin synthase large subunit CnxH [Aspergillus tubingensis]GLA62685.1 molybdopterin synthase catalytic subunit [Aspergillus tubingensis]GLB00477.1 molybdopterin synthase catalytic subunit [Aspergillus tubingensis]GLB13665.1 molybdopterin synthase catalytic subunit [Aspergillus tubingensis]
MSSTTPTTQTDQIPPHLDPQTYPRTTTNPTLNTHITLTYHPLDPTSALSKISSPNAGANVLFLGTTRNSFEDRPVAQLSYTAYPPLALKTLSKIAEDAVRKHELLGVVIGHRLGDVPIGESSIVIAVSAGHRGAAWRAGEEVLELCKEKAEIWKKEVFVDGQGEWRANRDRDAEGKLVQG